MVVTGEVEELQNRLRASRHRVSELEKELISVSASATAAGKQEKNHAQELDQLRLQNGMLRYRNFSWIACLDFNFPRNTLILLSFYLVSNEKMQRKKPLNFVRS